MIDQHRTEFGVQPVCEVLQFAPSTYRKAKKRQTSPAAKTIQDQEDFELIRKVYDDSKQLYGARKVWWQLQLDGHQVARCTVERLMAKNGLKGVVRGGYKPTTTISDPVADRARDLVDRNFTAGAPNRLWVTDFTYVKTWSGMVYVAFVIDVFSRRIVGWQVSNRMTTDLVLDALEMSLWARDRQQLPVGKGLVCHSDAGSQYTERLINAGVDASIGTVGDAYDNALAESTIGLFKTEVIRRKRVWKTLEDVEYATLVWADWYNNKRLHSGCDRLTPVAYEEQYREHALVL